MAHDDDIRFAHVLADDADSQTMARFRAGDLKVETKADKSPVTDADRATEEALRRTLARARPRDAVTGEEFGAEGYSSRRWVIDPIDGTKNYLRGVPVWATLIGLVVDDEVVAGVVSAPALSRRCGPLAAPAPGPAGRWPRPNAAACRRSASCRRRRSRTRRCTAGRSAACCRSSSS